MRIRSVQAFISETPSVKNMRKHKHVYVYAILECTYHIMETLPFLQNASFSTKPIRHVSHVIP